MFPDVASFPVNLQHRRDSSFYLCGEVCQFLSLLCSRVYTPDTVPLANAWFPLLRFQTSEATFLDGEEYLIRLRLSHKVSSASKAKAEGMHFGKKSERPAVLVTTETVKSDFVKDSQQYIQYLINEVLRQTGLTTNIVKGMAAFDPLILFKRPMEIALRHFDILYSTFSLRSWVSSANESLCRDQYMQLLDHLRTTYDPDFDKSSVSADLIEFLSELEFLRNRSCLSYLFKLCCLCATTVSPTYPDVTSGTISTAGCHNRLTDVILPSQSYVANVRDAVAFCSDNGNLTKFIDFSSSFGHSAFAFDYDPWTYVDNFGRSKIYKSLPASYRTALSTPQKTLVRSAPEDQSSVADTSAVKAPSSTKRRKMERRASRASSSSTAGASEPGSSKD